MSTVVADNIENRAGLTRLTADVLVSAVHAKALINGASASVIAGYGVASITRATAGQYVVTMTRPAPNLNYTVQITAHYRAEWGGGYIPYENNSAATGRSLTSFTVYIGDTAGSRDGGLMIEVRT